MLTNSNSTQPQHPSFIRQLILRILPLGLIVLAVALTVIWMLLLGYVVVKLIARALLSFPS